MKLNMQSAPYPEALATLIRALMYKDDWRFYLEDLDRGQGSVGLTLVISITTPDSYDHDQRRTVRHYFPVPPAAYDQRSWQRWLFDRIAEVDVHERCEFFEIDGVKPYAPSHGPGNDPYLVREIGTDLDVRTSYLGVVNPPTSTSAASNVIYGQRGPE